MHLRELKEKKIGDLVEMGRELGLENASNLRMKAELLAENGKVDDAIATAQKAITVGKAANPHFDPSEIDELLAQWKRR